MIIKFVLATLVAASMFYFLVVKRRSPLPKLFVVSFFGVGLLCVLRPEATNRVAAWIGVGRGADVVIYLSILLLFFICFATYIRLRETEERLAAVVRDLALERPLRARD